MEVPLISTFYKIRYILEELYVAVIRIISRLIIYIDQLNAAFEDSLVIVLIRLISSVVLHRKSVTGKSITTRLVPYFQKWIIKFWENLAAKLFLYMYVKYMISKFCLQLFQRRDTCFKKVVYRSSHSCLCEEELLCSTYIIYFLFNSFFL